MVRRTFMKRLAGRVAMVTGGGRGIGRSIALAFAREGCNVVVSSRTQTELESVVHELEKGGVKGYAIPVDVMSYESIRDAVAEAIASAGQLDILVNNAGGGVPPKTPEGLQSATHEDQAFIDNIDLNLTSAYRASREALPHMIARKYGRIINIGSGYAKRGGGGLAYTAAKHGIVGLTRAMATEIAVHNITVNCLCPGWTNTQLVNWDGLAMLWRTSPERAKARAAAECIQNRVLEPDELGPMAALIAAEESAGITGQVISVDGGYRV